MSRNHNWYCLVCRDVMSIHGDDDEEPQDAESQELHNLVATSCGHLFHRSCLQKSCDAKQSYQKELGLPVTKKSCPSCDREMDMRDCRRIFPEELPEENLGLPEVASGNDNEQELREKIEELSGEVHRLKATTKFQKDAIAALQKKLKAVPSTRAGARGDSDPVTFTLNDCQLARSYLTGIGYTIQEMADGSPNLPLRRSDAVVWLTDQNPGGHSGIIHWLTKIQNVNYAGIEFNPPLTSGLDFTPSNGVILFPTGQGHTGILVRVQELILYRDFHGSDYYPPDNDLFI